MRLKEKNEYFFIKDSCFFLGFTKPNFKNSILELEDLNKLNLKIATLKQIHSSKINLIKKGSNYKGDGLFTSISNLVLTVKTADCLPVFLYSKELNVCGIIHMGWRGAVSGILENIPFDLNSFRVIAGVGLRKCCYRVGKEFLEFSIYPFILNINGVLYFDVIEFTKSILISKGLKKENFLDLGICSFCSKEKFFSYRRDKTIFRTISFIVRLNRNV